VTGEIAPYGEAWSASLARAPEAELDAWLRLAHEACDEADAIAGSAFRRDLEISTKPDRTLVTQADTAIERAIRGRIAAAYPDHGLVGEEYGTEVADAPTRWYIDPIDGTHNFVRGVPLFGTLLAVERDGELQAAVLSAPALRERWWARRGGGAWARGGAGDGAPRRIRVSQVAAIEDAQVLYGSGREIAASGRAPGFEALLDAAWRERGFGDFWGYALVAEGAAEAMIEVGMHSWDLAPMQLLLAEAGGLLTDLQGVPTIHGAGAIGSNGRFHEQLVRDLAAG
jgi:histidinol-phosphatase